jgi:hypothetical protein
VTLLFGRTFRRISQGSDAADEVGPKEEELSTREWGISGGMQAGPVLSPLGNPPLLRANVTY